MVTLKSEIELMGGFRTESNKDYMVAVGTFKPIVFSIDIKVAVSKTDWTPEIDMLNINYVKNITNETKLFESKTEIKL